MSVGAGIAIAGIWIGVGLTGFASPAGAMVAAMCAMVATMFVADHD